MMYFVFNIIVNEEKLSDNIPNSLYLQQLYKIGEIILEVAKGKSDQ